MMDFVLSLSKEISDQIKKVRDLETSLKKEKNTLYFLLNIRAVNLLDNSSISHIRVGDLDMTRSSILRVSIRAAHVREAMRWLLTTSGSHKIMEQVIVDTPNPDVLMDFLKDQPLVSHVEYYSKIHWASLRAIISDLMGQGVNIPDQLFNVHLQETVECKLVDRADKVSELNNPHEGGSDNDD